MISSFSFLILILHAHSSWSYHGSSLSNGCFAPYTGMKEYLEGARTGTHPPLLQQTQNKFWPWETRKELLLLDLPPPKPPLIPLQPRGDHDAPVPSPCELTASLWGSPRSLGRVGRYAVCTVTVHSTLTSDSPPTPSQLALPTSLGEVAQPLSETQG